MRKAFSARLVGFRPHWPMFVAVIGSAMLGFSPIFVRMTDLGPISTAFYRLFLALPFILMWRRYEQFLNPASVQPVNCKDLSLMLGAGVFFAADLALWHVSLDLTTVMNATLFNNFVPFFVPIVTYLIYKQKTGYVFMLAICMAIAGSAVLTGESFKLSTDYVKGDILAIGSALMFVGYVLILQNVRKRHNAPTIMLWSSLSNGVCLGIMAVIFGESIVPQTINDWVGILSLAILVHMFGQGLLAYSVGHLSAAMVTITMLVAPIISAVLAWIIFGEDISLVEMIGAVIILISIVLARQDEMLRSKMKETI